MTIDKDDKAQKFDSEGSIRPDDIQFENNEEDIAKVRQKLDDFSVCQIQTIENGGNDESRGVNNTNFSLQLEQLENTNLLTVRIKWENPDNLMDDHKSHLLNKCNDAVLFNRGFPINPSIIENYEYFSDHKRLEILKDNEEIYPFEVGTEEYASSYDKDSNTWLYDLVLQAQFKTFLDFSAARDVLKELLESNVHVKAWSISQNKHALTHPGNLYVRGIPKDLTVDNLLPIFSKFGPVLSLKIIVDSNTGESLGYGFLSYPLGSQAARCIKELNGNLMNGSPLFINYHVERKERERIHLDLLKEDNDDERFRGVFVGNLPSENEDGGFITPEQVFDKFKQLLEPVEIVSYYFPKHNSNTNIEYKEDEITHFANFRENIETCSFQDEISPLKGYGFIKFSRHDMALKAIEVLNDYNWLGHVLIVNKAVQNKFSHNGNINHRSACHRTSISSRQSSFSGMSYYGSTIPAGSAIHLAPSFPVFDPAFSVSSTGSEDLSADKSPIISGSSGDGSPKVTSLPHDTIFTGHSASKNNNSEPVTASGSCHDSVYIPPCSIVYSTPGVIQAPHPQLAHCSNVHAVAAAAAAAFGGLPIPTRDQQESNLYVKHIPLSWKDEDLSGFYSQYGEIISAKIITVGGSKNESAESKYSLEDVPVGTSRGYGFVCFKKPLDASRAMMATDRYQVDTNHILYVSFAQKRGKSVSGASSTPNSSGNSNQHLYSSGSSSTYSSYHTNSRQGQFNFFVGNYNPKFINAMIQQQNQNVGGSAGNHVQVIDRRVSCSGASHLSYMVPIVLPPPPINAPKSSLSAGINKKVYDT